MEEVKKKTTTKKTTNTSKVQNKSKKKEVSQLSSDELMEQILNKKKKSVTKKSGVLDNSVKKTNTTTKTVAKKKTSVKMSELSSDELLEQILAKKKNKGASSTKRKVSTKSSEANNSTKKKVDLNELSSDELYDLIKSKKRSTKKSVNQSDTSKKGKVVDKDKVKSKLSDEELIITREITFTEDKFDLNNKELLKDLKNAIEEFDSLDDTAPVKYVEETEEVVESKKIISKKKIKIILIFGIIILLVLALLFIIFILSNVDKREVINKSNNKSDSEIVDNRPVLYEECLNKPLSDIDKTEEIIFAEKELTNYISNNYKASVIYEDLSIGFTYSYNSDEVYYAASTIKSLGALYIYTKAATGEIDLNDTVKYTSKFVWGSSKKMKTHKIGEEISLRKLVEYSVVVSDNSAHQMIVSYIGRNNLKEFGKSLGAQYTLYGSDNFGHITAGDAIIYMKALNDFINNNGELGDELKSYFVTAEQNSLSLEDLEIDAAHKYGEYSPYYHDIGIVYDDKPYVVAILTTEKNGDYQGKIREIHKHIYDLHELYYSTREDVCYLEIYGK